MRSRAAFDIVLKWGLGSVTYMIYMCKKAFFLLDIVSCSSAWPGSPHSLLICLNHIPQNNIICRIDKWLQTMARGCFCVRGAWKVLPLGVWYFCDVCYTDFQRSGC